VRFDKIASVYFILCAFSALTLLVGQQEHNNNNNDRLTAFDPGQLG